VNPRPRGFIGFAAACGVDLIAMAPWDALNVSIEPVRTYTVGRRCEITQTWHILQTMHLHTPPRKPATL